MTDRLKAECNGWRWRSIMFENDAKELKDKLEIAIEFIENCVLLNSIDATSLESKLSMEARATLKKIKEE